MTGRLTIALALVLLLTGCNLFVHEPPPGQTELLVDGRQMLVIPSVSRAFKPGGSPPDGSPLSIGFRLWAPDSQPLPADLNATRVWVVNGRAVWETGLARDDGWLPPYARDFHAHNGPKWEPGALVDVTLRFVLADTATWYLYIPDCIIERVE